MLSEINEHVVQEASRPSHDTDDGAVIKGREKRLIEIGEIRRDNMRSGDISVIPREKNGTPRIVDITVSEGIQTVLIEPGESD